MPVADVTCPDCQGTKLERYGKTRAGLQKYRCLASGCRRQFVAGSNHLIDPEVKAAIMKLLEAKASPAQVKAAWPDISLRWIYSLRRKLRNDQ